ncbi:hypothetical protein K461DRAFT_297758 [Myriangium duriaei CBS 260.36]|uniref:Uncharacterized protein n=1 Tax=Myriangium duriaei CBS 260.36 TaxID=1168546 RepID=A0A9P4ITC4_9PEZI|nr:hypothetical protein K461DRAFT_297758 [Myriangium duriaei CBS 260.36]
MSYQQHHLDGDQTAKAMDKGANAGLPHTDLGDGIHESAIPSGQPAGQKTTGAGVSAFDADKGAIGKQFHADGAIGSIGDKVGGPFARDGAVGKHFTTGGSVGSSVQEHLGQGENSSVQKQ